MEFLYLNVLYLILIPIILFIFLIATKKSLMQKLFPKAILDRLQISNKYLSKTTRNYLLFIALICFTIALARPVINEKEQSIEQEVTPIIVAIDVSKSMLANDIYPNRLTMAKNKLIQIIEKSQHNALGVMLFAKSAFILSPITQDFTSLSYLVKRLDEGLNFNNGSNILSLIEASNKLFKSYQNRNLLILSDGANKEDFSQEITLAKKYNISIYTLGLATNKPSPIKIKDEFLTDSKGTVVTVALNEKIKNLSFQTGGGYIPFTLNSADIDAILADIENKSAKENLQNQKFKTYTELFYYPLALGLLFLFLALTSLPRKKELTTLFILLYLPYESHAGLMDFKIIDDATKAYENNEFKKAAKGFEKVSQSKEGHYNYANSLYKQKKYKQAIEEYKKVITSDKTLEYKKLHNMGNAYAKSNQLEDAVKMYEKALNLKDDRETKQNLETVKKALEQKQNQENQQNKNQQQNQSDNKQQKKNNNTNQEQKQQNAQEQKKKEQQKRSKKDEPSKSEQKTSSAQQKDKENRKENKPLNQQQTSQELNQEKMSDLEEQKWLKKIQNKKTPVLLREVKTKYEEESSSKPW